METKPINEAIKEFKLNEAKPLDGYNDWLVLSKEADKISTEKSDILNKIAGNNKTSAGLTPDDIKNSKEFKKAKAEYEASAKVVRELNKSADKKWLRQKSIDRRKDWGK